MANLIKQAVVRDVRWQSHQSSNAEAPENTMSAVNYAWELGGIPELDIRQTGDGVIVGLHDATLKRTTDASESVQDRPVSEMTFAELQAWDAGVKFGERFIGEKIPSLEQLLKVLAEHPELEVYLDYKQVDLEKLVELIRKYGVGKQLIFSHNNHENCKTIKHLAPEIRTMLWVPGRVPESALQKVGEVRQTGYDSLDIIQLHLVDAEKPGAWRYRIGPDVLKGVYRQLADAGLALEVLPFHFDRDTLFALLDMGIRRFAVDEPKVFVEALRLYVEQDE